MERVKHQKTIERDTLLNRKGWGRKGEGISKERTNKSSSASSLAMQDQMIECLGLAASS